MPIYDRSFVLLREALRQSGKVAIAKIAISSRKHLVRLAAHGDGLILNTTRWPGDVRDITDVPIPSADLVATDKEVEMALMLVESMSGAFGPSAYADVYAEAVVAMMHEKAEGKDITAASVGPAPVIDLMEALRQSLRSAQSAAGARAGEDAAVAV